MSGRKVVEIRLDETAGRDAGKLFVLTEMPAVKAEKWAIRAFFALSKSGMDIPDELARTGFAGIAQIGLRALGSMAFTDAEPLLDELLGCVQIARDPTHPSILARPLDMDFEEVATLLRLRKEVFELHTGFFTLVAKLKSQSDSRNQNSSENT